jgi:hypothetical protein
MSKRIVSNNVFHFALDTKVAGGISHDVFHSPKYYYYYSLSLALHVLLLILFS